MSDPKSQSSVSANSPLPGRGTIVLAVFLAIAVSTVAASAEDAASEDPALLGIDTAIGRVEYHAGRGLRVGDTGLTVGGFATLNAESLETGGSQAELEGLNFLVFLDPVPFLHLFTELEVAEIGRWESGRDDIRSDPGVTVERLYGDLSASDAVNVRFGKFLTPIGRWNVVPAEPFVWTTSEPVIVEEVFDESATGAMLWGSTFPRGGALSYSAYGTFLDPIAPDREAPPADHSAGAHLEWASLGGWTVGASYFASESSPGSWNHLGGADLFWQPVERVELSAEALFGEGTRENGALSGFFTQAVVETLPTLYAVGRYERFDPPRGARSLDLFDIGLAWVPVPYLRLKADYLFADHLDELSEDLAEPGFRASLSVIF
ncbi:MAG: hypothetical protein ACREQY_23445 [Candidatus Binatia bacterium]